MKVLWFTNTSSLYDQGKHSYHGGGWIESLEELIKEQKGIDLGISFIHKTDNDKIIKNGTTYFPIVSKSQKRNPFRKLIDNWIGKIEIRDLQNDIGEVIRDYQPDLIQVFGTEGSFSQVQNYTQIPVIYHIQGLINPYLNTYLPINQSKFSFHFNIDYLLETIKGNSPAFENVRFRYRALREKSVLKNANYVMGRTHWDKMVVRLYNPKVKYFHVDEVLRPIFYKGAIFSKQKPDKKFKIVSTISPTIYKGIDVVLKAAKELKELTNFDFEWEIIGLEKNSTLLKHFEKTEKIMHQGVNILCSGRKNAQEIIDSMQTSDVFVHPSYIDNSPNSVCEAQMLGLPVIVCNVGGISTLVQHEKTGFLVPSNVVFELVHYLRQLKYNTKLRNNIGKEAKKAAFQRHNREKIIFDLLEIYNQLKN
jgi:glycosyltransferase involved in cell wall biosynthesis